MAAHDVGAITSRRCGVAAIGLRALGFSAPATGSPSPARIRRNGCTRISPRRCLGGACLGIYPTNPWPELQYILRHSRAKIVVCGDQEQTDKVIEARRRDGGLPDLETIVCVDMKGMRRYDEPGLISFDALLDLGRAPRGRDSAPQVDAALEAGDPDDVAIIVYTSGTTGMPKGAMLSHRNMLLTAARSRRSIGLDCRLLLGALLSPALPRRRARLLDGAATRHRLRRQFRRIRRHRRRQTCARSRRKGFLGVPRIWEKMRETRDAPLARNDALAAPRAGDRA